MGYMGCGDVPRDGWEENYCPVCVCELPPAEPSACDDVSLGFDGALTDKYGGSEACSILVPAWSVKTGITAQQMCQVPLTQFVDMLDGAWVPPPGTAADAKVHDFCKMTCGLENVGDCAATLQPQCETLKASGCEATPHMSSCVDGHGLYKTAVPTARQRLTCDGTAADAPASETLAESLVVRTTDRLRTYISKVTGGTSCEQIATGDVAGGTWRLHGYNCPMINVIELEEGTTFKLGGNEIVIPSFLGVKIVGRGAGATIDGEGLSRIITASAGSVLFMENVHLINGSTTGKGGAINVGAVSADVTQAGQAKLWLKDVSISDMTAADDGGGVYITDSSTVAEAFVFTNVTMTRCAALPPPPLPPPPPLGTHPSSHLLLLPSSVASGARRPPRAAASMLS